MKKLNYFNILILNQIFRDIFDFSNQLHFRDALPNINDVIFGDDLDIFNLVRYEV